MEKPESTGKSAGFSRLLKRLMLAGILTLCIVPCFAHKYSDYVFKPVDEYIFEGQDTVFETMIPNLKPQDIMITPLSLPRNVNFISSDKIVELDGEGVLSTKIRLVYRFNDIGDFNMMPVLSQIQYGNYYLTVENVHVLHNPETIQPVVKYKLLEEKNSYVIGDKIPLQLTVTFAKKITGFSVNLQENSALCQTQDKFRIPLTLENFTTTEYPIANFYFIPLEKGKLKVPDVVVEVRTWKGIDKTVVSEPMEFTVEKKSEAEQVPQEDLSILSNAETDQEENPSELYEDEMLKKQNVRLIADYRTLEKQKILSYKIRKERKQLEEKMGLKNTANEVSRIYFSAFLLLFAVTVVLLTIALVRKRKRHSVSLGIILFCILIAFSVFGINNRMEYALLMDEKIYSIPENESGLFFTLPLGTRVRIKGITKEWIYITYSENSSGWIKRENLIFIE